MTRARPAWLRFLGRGLGARGFTMVLLAVALLLLATPYPRSLDVRQLRKVHSTDASIAVTGPSTIDAYSKCDNDRRTVAEMLATATGEKVVNLSSGGQGLSDGINLAGLSGRTPSVTDVVLPISFVSTDESLFPPYRKLLMYRALAPSFNGAAATDIGDLWQGLSNQLPRHFQGFRFENREYGDYQTLTATELSRERSLETCPEGISHNMAFTRAYYWQNYVATGHNSALVPLVARLDADLKARGKRLHVVLLPANVDLIGRFDAGWRTRVEAGERRLAADLSAQRINTIDLSAKFRQAEFIQQWCACPHLNAAGRQRLAAFIADQVRAARRP